MLPRQDTIVVEMVTTKNDVGKFIKLSFVFNEDDKEFILSLFIRCDDALSYTRGWSYVVEKCTKFEFKKLFLKNVPENKVKLWKIKKTRTHMRIVCNDVTVLDFDFETDSNKDYKSIKDNWSGRLKSLNILNQFSEYTFVKTI